MKNIALPLLFVLATAGQAFADQKLNQAENKLDSYQSNENVTQSIHEDDSERTREASVKEIKNNSKSLKERERERKGLPRYWNG